VPGLVGPLSDAFLLALGRVTANFSILEGEITFFTCSLISRDQRLGQIITAELSFRARVALLSAAFRHRVQDQTLIDELEALLDRAHHVEEKRNIPLHSNGVPARRRTTATGSKPRPRRGRGSSSRVSG
jgi:hypothetical protein